MKKGLFLTIMLLIGIIATAQQNIRPEWFFNEDCKKIQEIISRIRQFPSQEDFKKYKMDSTSGTALEMNYQLGEVIKNNAPLYPYTNKEKYNKIDGAWKLSGNGFTYQSVVDMLLDNPKVANVILNTSIPVGLYVSRYNFYGNDLLTLNIIIPNNRNGIYTKIIYTNIYKH